jgi:hypothetical protein
VEKSFEGGGGEGEGWIAATACVNAAGWSQSSRAQGPCALSLVARVRQAMHPDRFTVLLGEADSVS